MRWSSATSSWRPGSRSQRPLRPRSRRSRPRPRSRCSAALVALVGHPGELAIEVAGRARFVGAAKLLNHTPQTLEVGGEPLPLALHRGALKGQLLVELGDLLLVRLGLSGE